MANDPSLRAEIGSVVAEFGASSSPDLDPHRRRTPRALRHGPRGMLGLALGWATNGGQPLGHERRVLDRLRREAAGIEARPTGVVGRSEAGGTAGWGH
jgi:hypothetical protein